MSKAKLIQVTLRIGPVPPKAAELIVVNSNIKGTDFSISLNNGNQTIISMGFFTKRSLNYFLDKWINELLDNKLISQIDDVSSKTKVVPISIKFNSIDDVAECFITASKLADCHAYKCGKEANSFGIIFSPEEYYTVPAASKALSYFSASGKESRKLI